MSGYIGAQPVPQATQHREAFTATASQTSFATVGYTPQFVDVYLNGVKLAAADYTATNGSDIVLTTGAALNDMRWLVRRSQGLLQLMLWLLQVTWVSVRLAPLPPQTLQLTLLLALG